jgi:hypothetical protein
MLIGETVKFELFLGRYVDGTILSVRHEHGLTKIKVQYGINSYATILADEILFVRKRPMIFEKPRSNADEDVPF